MSDIPGSWFIFPDFEEAVAEIEMEESVEEN